MSGVHRPLHRSGRLDGAGQPVSGRGSNGLHAVGEHLLNSAGDNGSKRIAAFAQAAVADARVSRLRSHVGAGIASSGWGLISDADRIGVSVTRVANGAQYQRAQAARNLATTSAEITVELRHLAVVTPHFTLQPDLQYVRHPNTDPPITSAWIFQMRLAVLF